MQTWNIDPKTGDYVLENGRPQETNSLKVAAYFRLKIKRKKWLYAPDDKYGADFYTIQKRPADNANQRFENTAVKALQPLVDDGRALQIEATVTQNVRSGTALETTIIDATGEVQKVTFNSLGF